MVNLKEKLEANVLVSTSGCWDWQLSRYAGGYGRISIGKQKQDYAHRVSYRVYHGEIPKGMVVRHSCDNPRCCNPEHLSLGTQRDNVHDCISRGRNHYPPIARGEANHKTKLTAEDVKYILQSTESNKVLAKMFNVTAQAIRWRRLNG